MRKPKAGFLVFNVVNLRCMCLLPLLHSLCYRVIQLLFFCQSLSLNRMCFCIWRICSVLKSHKHIAYSFKAVKVSLIKKGFLFLILVRTSILCLLLLLHSLSAFSSSMCCQDPLPVLSTSDSIWDNADASLIKLEICTYVLLLPGQSCSRRNGDRIFRNWLST